MENSDALRYIPFKDDESEAPYNCPPAFVSPEVDIPELVRRRREAMMADDFFRMVREEVGDYANFT